MQQLSSSFALAFARAKRAGTRPEQDREAGQQARRSAFRLISADGFDQTDARISVSHVDGLAAAIASLGAIGVGIDLVRTRAVSQIEQRYFLTSSELQQRPPLTPSQRWALKEAAWKALRCDRSTPLKALELVHGDKGDLTGVRKYGVLHPARSLLLRPWPHYVAAVVVLEND